MMMKIKRLSLSDTILWFWSFNLAWINFRETSLNHYLDRIANQIVHRDLILDISLSQTPSRNERKLRPFVARL